MYVWKTTIECDSDMLFLLEGCGEPILPENIACTVLSSRNLSTGYEPGDLLKCHCTRFGEEIAANHSQVIKCNPGGQWDRAPVCKSKY